ncbi:MAG: Na/Pi symporter [Gemmatimonadetes bacterium]|nr:Na/Pi symporter [Gemmatimonadota bacterium]
MPDPLAEVPQAPSPEPAPTVAGNPYLRALVVVGLLYLFLVGVNGLGAGFRALGEDALDAFFAATENPFIGLMVGILATTLVQSSSVTTSMIVGLVAAPLNPIPVANAVPMIMGANIGTTVTNTLASMAHIGRKEEFRRAFSVATVHDFFNYMAVLILLPLEIFTGYLQKSATALSDVLSGFGGAEYESPIKVAIKAGGVPIEVALEALLPSERAVAVGLIIVSAAMIFVTLVSIVRVMRASMQKRMEVLVSRALARNAWIAIAVGIIATVMVQSSSITTSLMVPLAGAGVLTLSQAFPVTLGANLGTTVTALLAALAATDQNAQAGLTIALVHLLFNLSGTVLIYPFEPIRRIPMFLARTLADVAVRSKVLAIAYVMGLFYAVPIVFAMLTQ